LSEAKNKTIAKQFVEQIFNEGKIEQAKNFVTPDIVYHGAEEIKGIEDFKSGFPKIVKHCQICRLL
jgi:predicted SnoaL-like aldol condensation-catalyzing enzyme